MKEKRKFGTFLKLPYDWRKPTRTKLRRGVWDSDRRRIFVPKVWGWGYGINVREIARRLRLIG